MRAAIHATAAVGSLLSGGPKANKAAVEARMAMLERMPRWRALRDEINSSGELRVSRLAHRPMDQARMKRADRRAREADEWIKTVRARKSTGIPVKSGLHEGQRFK